jgi:CheY-like chemotaxis protein
LINREVTMDLLSDVWRSVDVAENGLEAVELASQQRYGLILMDMQMPVMDGLTATRRHPGTARQCADTDRRDDGKCLCRRQGAAVLRQG